MVASAYLTPLVKVGSRRCPMESIYFSRVLGGINGKRTLVDSSKIIILTQQSTFTSQIKSCSFGTSIILGPKL